MSRPLSERTIADLRNGEHGYTLPWGLHEVGGYRWLNPTYPLTAESFGTCRMRVVKRLGVIYADGNKVHGLADFDGPKPDQIEDPELRNELLAQEHEKIAKQFDELGEPAMAADQRRIADGLRGTS